MCTTFIRRHIFRLPLRQLFTTRELLVYGSRAAVDQALSRLVKSETIIRLARGVFVRDRRANPTAFEVASTKAKAFGKAVSKHGSVLASELGLTAAKIRESIFYVSGRSSSFKFGDIIIEMIGVCPRKMRLGESRAGYTMTALWHLGKSDCTGQQIMTATQVCRPKDRQELRQAAAWMPAWMSSFFTKSRFTQKRSYVPAY